VKLFSNTRAAGSPSPFEHERFQSGFGEIARRNQSIMTGADDDDVVWHFKVEQAACLFIPMSRDKRTDKLSVLLLIL
jgi:hypothetical protein